MAKKVILKDHDNNEIMPITRGELILDSSGNEALHSNEFLATDVKPGLMSAKDKNDLDKSSVDATTSTTYWGDSLTVNIKGVEKTLTIPNKPTLADLENNLTKLGTVNAGSISKPIYFNNGIPVAINSLETSIYSTTYNDSTNLVNELSPNNNSSINVFRYNVSAPNLITDKFSSALSFGRHDTRGLLSTSFNTPLISVAGMHLGTGVYWYFKLKGTDTATYTLPTKTSTLASIEDIPTKTSQLIKDDVYMKSEVYNTSQVNELINALDGVVGGIIDTWRPIHVQNSSGSTILTLGDGNTSGDITLKAGTNLTASVVGSTVTFDTTYNLFDLYTQSQKGVEAYNWGNHAGKYLPLSGGTLTASNSSVYATLTLKTINNNNNNIIYFTNKNSNLSSVGHWNNLSYISNEINYARIGVTDEGVPQFWTHYEQGNRYTLLHEGNYNSYVPKLDGTGAIGTWNININGDAKSLNYETQLTTSEEVDNFLSSNKLRITTVKNLPTGILGANDGILLSIPWVNTVFGAQICIDDNNSDHGMAIRHRQSNIWSNWKHFAYTSDIPTKLSDLTDDVVSGKYLPLSGGTITNTTIPLTLQSDNTYSVIRFRTNNGQIHFGLNTSQNYLFVTPINSWDEEYIIFHSKNYINYINEGRFPGINKTGTVKSITAGTGLLGGTITTSGTISLATVGTIAGNFGLSANTNPGYAGTFKVPYITVDNYGRVTAISEKTVTLPSISDTKVTQNITTTNAEYPLLLTPSGQTATTTTQTYFDSGVTLNPSTNTITANINGSATKLTTPRTLWGQSFDGSGNVNGDITFSSTSKIGTEYSPYNKTIFNKIVIDGATDGIQYYSGGWTGSEHTVHTFLVGTDNKKSLVIKNSGFIGINTDTPTQRLQVNGNIKADTFLGNLDWSYIQNKPTSLPANGGNADTVDNKHASDFKYVNVNNYSYTPNLAFYDGSSARTNYYKLSITNVNNLWTMLYIEMSIKENYSSGNYGKIILHVNKNASNTISEFTIHTLGQLSSSVTAYANNNSSSFDIYIAGNWSWPTLNVDKITFGDSATSVSGKNITLTKVTTLPSSYSTASVITGINSSNYTSYINTTNFPGLNKTGTVTSVGLSVPTGFSVSSSPITISGTLGITFASGYSLPTTTKQNNWDSVYNWYTGITAADTDSIINKWGEIVDFIDSVAEGTDITDEFVTRKTEQTITGVKTFATNILTISNPNAGDATLKFYRGGNTAWSIVDTGGNLKFNELTSNTTRLVLYESAQGGSAAFAGQVTATKFITSGGTSSQFVKGDGSLDSNKYLINGSGAYTTSYLRDININGNNWTFWSPVSSGTSGTVYGPTTPGTSGQYLMSNGSGAPIWTSLPALASPYAIKFKNTAGTEISYNGSVAVDLTGGIEYAKLASQLSSTRIFGFENKKASYCKIATISISSRYTGKYGLLKCYTTLTTVSNADSFEIFICAYQQDTLGNPPVIKFKTTNTNNLYQVIGLLNCTLTSSTLDIYIYGYNRIYLSLNTSLISGNIVISPESYVDSLPSGTQITPTPMGNVEMLNGYLDSDFWKKTELTKVSQLANDSGYLTSLPSHTHNYASIGSVVFTPANSELTSAEVLSLTGGWSIKKGTWDYSGNGYIKAGDFGNIDLAGTSIITIGSTSAYTQLYITAPSQSGHSGKTNEIFFYNNHGSTYLPGWTRVLTNRNYSSYALPLTGGTLSGLLTINNTANYAFDQKYISLTDDSVEGARIGIDGSSSSGLGLYAKGTIYLRPNSSFSASTYGLVISSTSLTYNGQNILHAGNYSSYLGYIGTTAVQSSSVAQSLTGIANATMSGTTTTNLLVISNTSGSKHIQFSRASYNYFYAPTSGSIAFCVNGYEHAAANCDLVISGRMVHPGASNQTNLGSANYRWNNIYCVGGNFTSDVNSETKFKASNSNGAVSVFTSTNRGLYDETNGAWIIYLLKDASHVYVPKWANKGSASVPVYFNSSGEPVACTTYLGYIGTTAVQASSASQSLTGIVNITMSGTLTMNANTGIQMKYNSNSSTGDVWMYPNGAQNYGIRYYEGTPDKMAISASGNNNTIAGSDLCINGNGDGTVTIRGNTILHTGNIDSNNLTTINKTLTLTQNWMDTGIDGDDFLSGTYIIQVTCSNESNLWDCYWSGVMSWWKGRTNDTESDEIILHRAGRSYDKTIYLRTIMRTNTDGNGLKLQIASNDNIGSSTYTFKFKRVI